MKKVGFPLEIRILHILQSDGWNTTCRYSFPDKETAKTRELDCLAAKGVLFDQQIDALGDVRSFTENAINGIRLLIECKRSTKPWVFYATHQDGTAVFQTKILGENPAKFSGSEQDKLFNQELIKNLHQYSLRTEVATNYFEPFTNGEGIQILDASMKVVKGLNYDKQKIASLASNWKLSIFGIYYYPVIVFEGDLFQCTIEKEGETFSRAKYLQLICDYVGESYRIDVVSSDFFNEFLKYVNAELLWIKKLYMDMKQRVNVL
jgi:hypothetical protein